MTEQELLFIRLQNQWITNPKQDDPYEIVKWMCATQAQDYLGALWSIGVRSKNLSEDKVEEALKDKKIVRTWPMRGTLHFVASEDARWMLKLLTPRVISGSKTIFRQSGLNEEVFVTCKNLFIKLLQGGKQLIREEIYQALEQEGISVKEQRGLHIIGYLAQTGLICFGPRKEKQQTFVLLEEWLPAGENFVGDEALAELAKRYYKSRGPATVEDFSWWSGLTLTQAKLAAELVKRDFSLEKINNKIYLLSNDFKFEKEKQNGLFFLPGFDEYFVGYKDRDASLGNDFQDLRKAKNGLLSPTVILEGKVIGTWKRFIKKDKITIELDLYASRNKVEKEVLKASEHYGRFSGLDIELIFK